MNQTPADPPTDTLTTRPMLCYLDGYVDSDKVEISTSDLRSMMGVGGSFGHGGDSSVTQIPTEDDEVIYDQTGMRSNLVVKGCRPTPFNFHSH